MYFFLNCISYILVFDIERDTQGFNQRNMSGIHVISLLNLLFPFSLKGEGILGLIVIQMKMKNSKTAKNVQMNMHECKGK